MLRHVQIVLFTGLLVCALFLSGSMKSQTPLPGSNWHENAFFGIHYDLHATATDTELGRELIALITQHTYSTVNRRRSEAIDTSSAQTGSTIWKRTPRWAERRLVCWLRQWPLFRRGVSGPQRSHSDGVNRRSNLVQNRCATPQGARGRSDTSLRQLRESVDVAIG